MTGQSITTSGYIPRGLSDNTRALLRRLFVFSLIALAFANGASQNISVNGLLSGISVSGDHVRFFLVSAVVYFILISIIAFSQDYPLASDEIRPIANEIKEAKQSFDELKVQIEAQRSPDHIKSQVDHMARNLFSHSKAKTSYVLLFYIEFLTPTIVGLWALYSLLNWAPQELSILNECLGAKSE